MWNCTKGNILKEAGMAILEHSVYKYAGIIPGDSIVRNARLSVGLALWIVKACEFDFSSNSAHDSHMRVRDLIE